MSRDESRLWPHELCFRSEPHSGHRHVNEGANGGCGLPEWCVGVPDPIAAERERIAVAIERMSSPHAGDPFQVRADAARLARSGGVIA